MATAASASKQRTFLGHPLGLYVLFFTEMWERFSYYGMRALLFVYMVNYFRWTQQESSYIMQMYTSLVYLTPILGGYLADRYLGNRRAVVIGALLMAIGHFLMAFDEFQIFMAALMFLIFGNGFFKPNMSTQVGRLYPVNDGRRDGGYTIFYMGINLGAFLSPLICGWLAENTVGGYHSGFTMAGIGMMLGLIIYLLGQPLIKEIPQDAPPAGAQPANAASPATQAADNKSFQPVGQTARALTEAEAERAPSMFGKFIELVPVILYLAGASLLSWAAYVAYESIDTAKGVLSYNAVAFAVGGACLALIGYLVRVVKGALRDRILVILTLGVFLVFFWGAFEQASSVLNIWADQFTNRYLTEEMQAPPKIAMIEKEADEKPEKLGYWARFKSLFPNMVKLKKTGDQDAELGWWEFIKKSFNPVPTAWYQSINAVLIVLLAPLFAWMWTALDRRGMQPSIPLKMALGVGLMSASMAIMVQAARDENQRSETTWTQSLPQGLTVTQEDATGALGIIRIWANPEKDKLAQVDEKGKKNVINAGRLTHDKGTGKIVLFGVLDKNECDRLVEATAPKEYQAKVKEFADATQTIDGDSVKSIEIQLNSLPPGLKTMKDWQYSGLKDTVVKFDPERKTLTAYTPLARKEILGMNMAGGDADFRETVLELYVQSSKFRVSMWWLFWSYLLATMGELCLSPVGLSMVSKLAPARFATMLMGLWFINNFFGNFVAGAMAGIWGTIDPINFYMLTTVVVGGAALVLLLAYRWVLGMMHGVN